MDLLINSESRSLRSYFQNKIIPLSLYKLGSINDILSMKVWEIEEAASIMQEDDMIELYYNLQGIPTKD
jgi:hypothetical protein